MTLIEQKFIAASNALQAGDKASADYLVYEGYRAYCSDPYMLSNVTNYPLIGNVLSSFYDSPTIANSNDSIRQQIASLAFLFLSKALEQYPTNVRYRQMRLFMLDHTRDVFVHTFCDSQIDMEHMSRFDSPVRRARVDIDKMIYADLCYSSEVSAPQYLRGLKDDLENDRLIPNRFVSSCISSAEKSQFILEGNQYIKRLTAYLEEKVFEDGDIEFDTEYE